MVINNLEEKYKTFKNILNIWSQRETTLKGKITVVKSVALSQLLYVCSALYIPDDYIVKIDNKISRFV